MKKGSLGLGFAGVHSAWSGKLTSRNIHEVHVVYQVSVNYFSQVIKYASAIKTQNWRA